MSFGASFVLIELIPDVWQASSYTITLLPFRLRLHSYGKVAGEWEVKGDDFTMTLTVPPNSSAVVTLPSELMDTYGTASYTSIPRHFRSTSSRHADGGRYTTR